MEQTEPHRLKRRLLALLNAGDGRIFYTVSGAEAVENALKMARLVTGRTKILARAHSYHGATLGALSVTGDWRGQEHFSVQDQTLRIPEPDTLDALQKTRVLIEQHDPKTFAAFCLETIVAFNGILAPPQEWWTGIQKLAEEFAIPLILDEVSCGFGRMGQDFAFQRYDLKPDFVCMAKAISGGYVPLGALFVTEKIARFWDSKVLNCGLTSYAHPLALAAA